MAATTPPIDHVVFDMGNVLMAWEPHRLTAPFVEDPADAATVADSIFDSPEWCLVDACAISELTMLRVAEGRLPERLHPALERVYAVYHELMRPLWAVNRLAMALHGAGAHLHILSNVGERFRLLGPRIPILGLCEGVVISGYERTMKPDVALFQILMGRFGLEAPRCVFVDDSARNCAGGERAGLHAFHFTGDVEALRAHLAELGVPGAAEYVGGEGDDLPFQVPAELRQRAHERLAELIAQGGSRLPQDPRPAPGSERLWPELFGDEA